MSYKSDRQKRRDRALKKFANGETITAIAKSEKVAYNTVKNWIEKNENENKYEQVEKITKENIAEIVRPLVEELIDHNQIRRITNKILVGITDELIQEMIDAKAVRELNSLLKTTTDVLFKANDIYNKSNPNNETETYKPENDNLKNAVIEAFNDTDAKELSALVHTDSYVQED